ncbi:hypothetical protein JXM67_00085 [candidate division WOR-3 bacterium]|nr:hypothetical protein [candidate division WOR-3 bacterium]
MFFVFLLLAVSNMAGTDQDLSAWMPEIEQRPKLHLAWELPPDLDQDLAQKIKLALASKDPPSPPVHYSPQELFVYEAALGSRTNKLNQEGAYKKASIGPKSYIASISYDSIPLRYGGDLRAFLLYNLADALYYSSSDPSSVLASENRNEARKIYGEIVRTFPESYVASFARLALAWYTLQGDPGEAIPEFRNVFYSTGKQDVQILAAYGKALAHYYNMEFDSAWVWFLDKEGYKENLYVVADPEEATGELTYSPLLNDLIDKALFWKAMSAESGEWWGDALDVYIHITEAYPDRPTAGFSYEKIVDFYIRGGKPEKAVDATKALRKKMKHNPVIYKEAYEYAIWLLYENSLSTGDDKTAGKYARTLYKETGNSQKLEEFYYDQTMRISDASEIKRLKKKIEQIRRYNPASMYLVEPMFNLSVLYGQDGRWEEALGILEELKKWPDLTRDIMPDLVFQSGRAYYELEDFEACATELELWIQTYTAGNQARLDLAPNAYWMLGLAYFQRAKNEASPQSSVFYYRKAKETLETIKTEYSDSEYHDKEFFDTVDALIEECKRHIQ